MVDGSSDTLDNGVGWTTHIDPRRGICRCFSGPQGPDARSAVRTSDVTPRDTAFVRVRTNEPMTLRWPPDAFVKTFSRSRGEDEYEVRRVISEDEKDTVTVQPPEGTDLLVLLISCDGPWTLSVG